MPPSPVYVGGSASPKTCFRSIGRHRDTKSLEKGSRIPTPTPAGRPTIMFACICAQPATRVHVHGSGASRFLAMPKDVNPWRRPQDRKAGHLIDQEDGEAGRRRPDREASDARQRQPDREAGNKGQPPPDRGESRDSIGDDLYFGRVEDEEDTRWEKVKTSGDAPPPPSAVRRPPPAATG